VIRTIFCYLKEKPSRDLVITAHQKITQECWEARSGSFDLFISELVISETGVEIKLPLESALML
jgi:hypothetical protein